VTYLVFGGAAKLGKMINEFAEIKQPVFAFRPPAFVQQIVQCIDAVRLMFR
jgi:hypothetical protein